jgi:hypothetical protein
MLWALVLFGHVDDRLPSRKELLDIYVPWLRWAVPYLELEIQKELFNEEGVAMEEDTVARLIEACEYAHVQSVSSVSSVSSVANEWSSLLTDDIFDTAVGDATQHLVLSVEKHEDLTRREDELHAELQLNLADLLREEVALPAHFNWNQLIERLEDEEYREDWKI